MIKPLSLFMIEEIKAPECDPKDLKYFFFDIDDTLIPWVALQARTLKALLKSLTEQTGLPEDKLIESMKEVFGDHETMDYGPLMQNIRVLKQHFRAQYEELGWEEAADYSQKVTHTARTAYTIAREWADERMFPGTRDLLKLIREKTTALFAITDAPLYQAKRRLYARRSSLFFTHVFGQDQEGVRECDRFQVLPGLKPEIDLSQLIGVTREEIRQFAVVIGNSFKSDVGLAAHNGCLAIQSLWSNNTAQEYDIINNFSPQKLQDLHQAPLTAEQKEALIAQTSGYVMTESPEEIERLLCLPKSSH